MLIPGLVILGLIALFAAYRMRRELDLPRGAALAVVVAMVGGAWSAWQWPKPPAELELGSDPTAWPAVSPATCAECHPGEHESWHRTFHRSMTREATPENVKARFDGTPVVHANVTGRMKREGDRYALEYDTAGVTQQLSVDRIVGSHWFQQFLHHEADGTYIRLPVAYHLVEQRWVHISGLFLAPERNEFFTNVMRWNETCLYCHNTRPSKNPLRGLGGEPSGYETSVGELGISCEACHGAGAKHVRENRANAAAGPASIVHPTKLPVDRADEICARCHGGVMPRTREWNRETYADPFLAGRELRRYWFTLFSEAEKSARERDPEDPQAAHLKPERLDARFWPDGTPLTTALEYQGMSLSKCYEGGRGRMTCLTCHTMHGSDPNHQLKTGMRTNEACYSCHPGVRDRLREHTHHAAESTGSQCQNCHMSRQVYSLLDVHRSHRIDVPRVRDSIDTGKPHACNLCHLDKSLGWTQDTLGKWYGTKPEPLSEDDRTISSAVLHLMRSDARSRAVAAGAFAWPPAQAASGTDWAGPVLIRSMEIEKYQAVRYLAFKALRATHPQEMKGYDYQGNSADRDRALNRLRAKLAGMKASDPNKYPFPPTDWDAMLKGRLDPEVYINE